MLLGAWPGLLRDAQEEERLAQELVQNGLYTALTGTVFVADLMTEGGAWLASRPSETLRGSERSVPVTPALANFSRRRQVRNRLAAMELSELQMQLGKIVTLLKSEVAR